MGYIKLNAPHYPYHTCMGMLQSSPKFHKSPTFSQGPLLGEADDTCIILIVTFCPGVGVWGEGGGENSHVKIKLLIILLGVKNRFEQCPSNKILVPFKVFFKIFQQAPLSKFIIREPLAQVFLSLFCKNSGWRTLEERFHIVVCPIFTLPSRMNIFFLILVNITLQPNHTSYSAA